MADPSPPQPAANQPGDPPPPQGETLATALAAARDAAAERLDQLRSVVESATDYAVITLDLDGCVVGWSTGAEATFGHRVADVTGRPASLIFTDEDRAAGVPELEMASARERGVAQDNRWHLRADGRRIYVHGSMRPVRNDAGVTTGFVKVCRDETDRQTAAETLSWAAAIVETSEDAIVSKSLDGVIRTWNPGAERLFGYPAAEAVGRPIIMLLPPDRLDEERRILERLRAGLRVDHFETVRVRKDGTRVDVSVTISPLRDATGRVTGASKIARDITGRRRAEAAVRDSEARLADVVQNSLDCIVGMDHAGLVTGWNPAAERTFGYAGAEVLGRPLADLIIPPALRERHQQGLARYLATGHGPVLNARLELSAVGRDGVEFPVELSITPMARADPPRFTGYLRDISERKHAEAARERLLASEQSARAEAERQGRIKDDFLATLGHELRTPLNAIVGWAQILRSSGGDPADLAEGLAVIDRNARAQTQIIADILDMSRIVAGKLRLDVRPVDLAALVRAGMDTVQPAADAKGVRLEAELDPAVGPVRGDPDRLHQVFWNLLSNAVKFTPRGGRVRATVGRAGDHVEVGVTDTGEGIDASFLPHVFDRFRQADASTTRRHGGLGLGLSIVRQLVELHGGSVRVTSPGPGLGSTFVVALPLSPDRPGEADGDPGVVAITGAEGPASADLTACAQLAGVAVLVVDDEPDGRAVIRRLLEDCGAVVRTAGSAAEAIALLAAAVPDVLVSDIGMPGEDGYELIRQVRGRPANRGGSVPAIALTAYARAADRARAVDAGFHAHLPKPVDPAELVATVAALSRPAGR